MDKNLDKSVSSPARRIETVTIRGEEFDLLPERCAFRRADQTLLASDLHWGKAETFQNAGLALPSTVIEDDLARLSFAICTTKAERLLILGDLIHSACGVTQGVKDRVSLWRKQHANLTLQVIRGNHDRQYPWPESWNIDDIGTELEDGEFLFTHDEPRSNHEEKFVWMGHIHPVVHLKGGGDSLRLPCFMTREISDASVTGGCRSAPALQENVSSPSRIHRLSKFE